MHRTARILVACSFLLLLAACGPSNYVRLNYTPEHPAEAMKPDAPVVAVVQFTDLRSTENIGQRSDQTPFMPVASVPKWISSALEEELQRRGMKTMYVLSADQTAGAEHVITGEVRKVWIEELSTTDYRMNMELAVKVGDAPATTFKNVLNDQYVPREEVPQMVATQGLKDIMQPIVEHVMQAVSR